MERGLSVGWGWGGNKLVKNEGKKTERRERDEVRKDIFGTLIVHI